MRTVDPFPAQVASMDKDTVLRLLTVLAGGSLLKRGSEVEIGVSRWAWSLLARLPERGELNSEEIGIIRELGKKAVLVGVGLKAEKSWEEGIKEFEAGYNDGVDEVPVPVENEEEIPLENDDIPNIDTEIQKDSGVSARIISPIQPGKDAPEIEIAATREQLEDEDFLAAKARMLNTLADEPLEINIEPEIITPKDQTPEPDSEAEDSDSSWRINTKATLDMIVTVAGEVYGQRDLLEFRDQWSDL
jgi:hypothetical protein